MTLSQVAHVACMQIFVHQILFVDEENQFHTIGINFVEVKIYSHGNRLWSLENLFWLLGNQIYLCFLWPLCYRLCRGRGAIFWRFVGNGGTTIVGGYKGGGGGVIC